jgi:lipoyl(octanoyl) transferase
MASPAASQATRSGGTVRAAHLDLGRLPLAQTMVREGSIRDEVVSGTREPTIITVEHDPVFTVGRAGVRRAFPRGDPRRYPHVLRGATRVVEVDRGGDVTWHGHGQLVVHPVLPIRKLGISLTGYLRLLEAAAFDALRAYGIEAHRRDGFTGVWVGDRKVGFIGVACRKWVTYHGLSINLDCDLDAFEAMVPCGIEGCRVTSLAHLVEPVPAFDALGTAVVGAVAARAGLDLVDTGSYEREVAVG